MDFAEKANKLKAERLAQEELKVEQEAKDNEITRNKRIGKLTLWNQRTEELRPFFQQFNGYKIANGHITLEIGGGKDNYGADLVCLKIGAISGAAAKSEKLGKNVLSARFGTNDKFLLEQHRATDFVGEYATANELMEALAVQVSRM